MSTHGVEGLTFSQEQRLGIVVRTRACRSPGPTSRGQTDLKPNPITRSRLPACMAFPHPGRFTAGKYQSLVTDLSGAGALQ